MVIESEDDAIALGQLQLANRTVSDQLAVGASLVAHELVCQPRHRVRRHYERRLVEPDLADVAGIGGDGLLDRGVVGDPGPLLLVGDVSLHVAGVQAPERAALLGVTLPDDLGQLEASEAIVDALELPAG